MARPMFQGEAPVNSASGTHSCRERHAKSPRRRNADQRDRGVRGQSIEFAAGDRHGLIDRIDAGQVDQLAADYHKDVRRDRAVAVIDRRVLPQPPQPIERRLRDGRADHAVAALHANDAVEIDRPNRTAALPEDSPASFLHLTLVNAHARRGSRERDALQTEAHCVRRDLAGFDLADFIPALPRAISEAPMAVARTRWVFWSTSIVTSTLSGAAPSLTAASNASRRIRLRSSGCGLGMTRSTTSRTSASATPIEEITSASLDISWRRPVRLEREGSRPQRRPFADQHRLIAIELVFGNEIARPPE